MDHREQVNELLARANALGHGETQLALTEEAVRLADRHGDIDAGFEARQDHIRSTMFSGHPDQMLVAFSWCLAQVDRNPDRFDLARLLWQYKWVINALPEFPQIERSQIDAMFVDMERRYRAYGSTGQAIQNKRRGVAIKMGDANAARTAHDAMASLRRDSLSDCLACEMDEVVQYHGFLGDHDRAVASAAPILRGRYSCSEVPQVTYAKVLRPLLQLGRGGEAVPHHLQGYRLISRNPAEFICQTAEHIEFLTLTDNLARGLRLFEKHLILAIETCCPGWRFRVYAAAKLLLEQSLRSGRRMLKLRLPDAFPLKSGANEYDARQMHQWFSDQLLDLAQRFDARNGNDYHTRLANESEELLKLAVPIPIGSRFDRDA